MNKPDVYEASDYAGLETKNAKFYYGYEQKYCKTCKEFIEPAKTCDYSHEMECCFMAAFEGIEIKIPFSTLGGTDEWDCVGNLLLGIGFILAKYHLELDTKMGVKK